MNGPKFTSQGLLAEGETENWEVSKFKEESRYFKRQYEIIAEKLKICDEYNKFIYFSDETFFHLILYFFFQFFFGNESLKFFCILFFKTSIRTTCPSRSAFFSTA